MTDNKKGSAKEPQLLEYHLSHCVADCQGFINCKCSVHYINYLVKFCGDCDACKKKEIEKCVHFKCYYEEYSSHDECEMCNETLLYVPFYCEIGLKRCIKTEISEKANISVGIKKLLDELKIRETFPKTGKCFKLRAGDFFICDKRGNEYNFDADFPRVDL
jgi:hypothetical protein